MGHYIMKLYHNKDKYTPIASCPIHAASDLDAIGTFKRVLETQAPPPHECIVKLFTAQGLYLSELNLHVDGKVTANPMN